jgi:virginiamycin B lyase
MTNTNRFALAALMVFPVLCEAQVSVQEYPIPRGLFAHDVWADAAPGGPVYFCAQRSGHLGILDPKTGKVETVACGSIPGRARSSPGRCRRTAATPI